MPQEEESRELGKTLRGSCSVSGGESRRRAPRAGGGEGLRGLGLGGVVSAVL